MITLDQFKEKYPNFQDSALQYFDDVKDRKQITPKHIHMIKVDWSSIKKLNKKGAGIYFSVNSMQPGERSRKGVTHINTRIVESDDLSKEEQKKLIKKAPLRPSIVIESKNSYHIYYLAKDGDKETREQINRGLAKYYKGDPAICSDTSRVLRLPGFMHNKNIDDPFEVKCLMFEDNYYTKEEMMKAFPYEKPKPKKEYKSRNKYEDIRGLMSSQDDKTMLEKMSGGSLVRGEQIDFKRNGDGTEQIRVNGESTGAWIDLNGKIGSNDNGGPGWIQRALWYGNSKSEVLRRFRDNCAYLIPEEITETQLAKEYAKIQKEEKEEEQAKKIEENFKHITYKEKIREGWEELLETDPEKVMKRGWEEWDSLLGGIYGGKIYLIGAETGSGKTTFVNQVADNLSMAGVRVTRYSLEDRMQDNAKEELYYTVNRLRYKKGKQKLEWIHFVNGEYTTQGRKLYEDGIFDEIAEAIEILNKKQIIELDKKKDIEIDEIVELMEQECKKGTRVFVIDHLHYFAMDLNKQRQDLVVEEAMKKINDVARRRNVAIFLVAHYNSNSTGTANINHFKGSSSIKQIANIIIQIERDVELDYTNFVLTKLRGPIKTHDIEATFDISTYTYNFTKTKEQKEKEKTFSLS